jgi:hypothetical protein
MPSVTHAESPAPSSGKKRRRDDNGEVQMPLYASLDANQLGMPPANLDILCSTSTPPMTSSSFNNNDRLVFHHASPNRGVPSTVFSVQRKILPLSSSKRVRVSEHDENEAREVVSPYEETKNNDFSHGHPDHHSTSLTSASTQPRPVAARTTSTALLSPCHICHRKPTKKSDLDSFAECLGCGQRTCYVCIRQCQGWLQNSSTNEEPLQISQDLSASFTMHDVDDEVEEVIENQAKPDKTRGHTSEGGGQGWSGSGHRSVVCSRCCVERGSEGDVVCLGCLAGIPSTG